MQFSGVDLDADGSANGKKHLINSGHVLKIKTRHSSSFARWPELRRCMLPANRIEILTNVGLFLSFRWTVQDKVLPNHRTQALEHR